VTNLVDILRCCAKSSRCLIWSRLTRATAKEAYIYGYPLVDNCRAEYAYFVDRKDPEFKAPLEPWPKPLTSQAQVPVQASSLLTGTRATFSGYTVLS
jgi:hypothetical protein